jgi:hypothetical protein
LTKPSRILLPLDDDLAVLRARFDFSNVSACPINLLGDQGRALQAAKGFAARHVMGFEKLRVWFGVNSKRKLILFNAFRCAEALCSSAPFSAFQSLNYELLNI